MLNRLSRIERAGK